MDYADGSKEAKLAQEILHLIEEAVFRRDGVAVGFMSEMIMEEMKKKGFNEKNFSLVSVHPEFSKEYESVLTNERLPFLMTKDIMGNSIVIVRAQDEARLLEADALIKKGSSKYTRSEYAKSFISNNKKLGRETYCLDLNQKSANIIAAKSFSHESGFVTSYQDGKLYFDETAAKKGLAEIFLDTTTSTLENTQIGRIKTANNIYESMMVEKVKHAMRDGNERYFANAFNNKSKYLHIENGILEVHDFKGKIDVVTKSYNVSDFDNEEALHHIVATELGHIHDCRDLTEKEFDAYIKKTRADLTEDKNNYLIKQADTIIAFENEDNPKEMANTEYLITDTKILWETRRLLEEQKQKLPPEERSKIRQKEIALERFGLQKKAQEEFLIYVKSELKSRQFRNPNFTRMSNADKLDWQLKTMKHILTYDDNRKTLNFLKLMKKDGQSLDRETLINAYAVYSDNVQTVSQMQEKMHTQTQVQNQTQTPMPTTPTTPPA